MYDQYISIDPNGDPNGELFTLGHNQL